MLYYLNENLLALLEADPHKFNQVYQGNFAPIVSPKLKQRQKLGNQFHQIVRQLLLGLPVEPLLEAYPKIKHWVEQLQQAAPEIFQEQPGCRRSWDEQGQVVFNDVVLSTTYDLVIQSYSLAEIIDWTTSFANEEYLETSWNTQLKLYLFAENYHYLPDKITLTYWQVNDENEPLCCHFDYSQKQHDAFKDRLALTLLNLRTPAHNLTNQHANPNSLTSFLQGQIPVNEYVASVPEVEI